MGRRSGGVRWRVGTYDVTLEGGASVGCDVQVGARREVYMGRVYTEVCIGGGDADGDSA